MYQIIVMNTTAEHISIKGDLRHDSGEFFRTNAAHGKEIIGRAEGAVRRAPFDDAAGQQRADAVHGGQQFGIRPVDGNGGKGEECLLRRCGRRRCPPALLAYGGNARRPRDFLARNCLRQEGDGTGGGKERRRQQMQQAGRDPEGEQYQGARGAVSRGAVAARPS